jgi:hypothetical protein
LLICETVDAILGIEGHLSYRSDSLTPYAALGALERRIDAFELEQDPATGITEGESARRDEEL